MTTKWEKQTNDGSWSDDGFYYCRDFYYWSIYTYLDKGKYVVEMTDHSGSTKYKKGKSAKSLKEAKENAERLLLTALQKMAKQLGYKLVEG